jgi:hypothetical protein
MSQFVRRWADWEKPGTPRHATDRTDKTPVRSPDTPKNRTDKTDKSPSVSFVSRTGEASRSFGRSSPCPECRDLEAKGVTVLHCATCGYEVPAEPRPQPRPGDLVYPLAYVRVQAPGLHEPYLGRFRHWTWRFREAGWSQEDAERAAFRRVLLSPPAVKSKARGAQLELAVEVGDA